MTYLLDTHVVLWWLTDDRKLSKGHAKLIERSERSGTAVGLSAISLWEIAKLVEHGRLELNQSVRCCGPAREPSSRCRACRAFGLPTAMSFIRSSWSRARSEKALRTAMSSAVAVQHMRPCT